MEKKVEQGRAENCTTFVCKGRATNNSIQKKTCGREIVGKKVELKTAQILYLKGVQHTTVSRKRPVAEKLLEKVEQHSPTFVFKGCATNNTIQERPVAEKLLEKVELRTAQHLYLKGVQQITVSRKLVSYAKPALIVTILVSDLGREFGIVAFKI